MPRFKPKLYIKDESFDPIYKTSSRSFYFKARIMPGLLLALGFVILGTQVAFPLIYFKTQDTVEKPVTSTVLGVASGFRDFDFAELKQKDGNSPKDANIPEYFFLTIPKLNIKEALVETESTNLSPINSLGHYKGSSLPGEVGNTFVYGHSVLTWFYNPKNYKTIFSTLDQLDTGDELYVSYNNKQLTYKVENKEFLSPQSVGPLTTFKPGYLNESTLTLMTCWPAGTKAKRLLVKAVMVD